MTAGWNDLPPELRLKIIENLDFLSRIRLSTCGRMEQQLVRSTPFKLDMIMIKSPCIWLKQGISNIRLDLKGRLHSELWLNLRTQHPHKNDGSKKRVFSDILGKEALTKVFNSIGTKCSVEKLVLQFDDDFLKTIDWFRNNFIVTPNNVELAVKGDGFQNIDDYFNWPQNVAISCQFDFYTGPFLEQLDRYDNIVKFIRNCYWHVADTFTDETLMKLGGASHIELNDTIITKKGFLWWIKRWLVRDDYKSLKFKAYVDRANFDLDELSDDLGEFFVSNLLMPSDYEHWMIFVRNKLTKKIGTITLDDTLLTFENVKRRYWQNL